MGSVGGVGDVVVVGGVGSSGCGGGSSSSSSGGVFVVVGFGGVSIVVKRKKNKIKTNLKFAKTIIITTTNTTKL